MSRADKEKGKAALSPEPPSGDDPFGDDFGTEGAPAASSIGIDAGATPEPPPVAKPPPPKASPRKAAAAGHQMCRVTASAVIHNGRRYEIDEIAEFDDASIAQLPEVLVPVE
jgi:hypothetical protein